MKHFFRHPVQIKDQWLINICFFQVPEYNPILLSICACPDPSLWRDQPTNFRLLPGLVAWDRGVRIAQGVEGPGGEQDRQGWPWDPGGRGRGVCQQTRNVLPSGEWMFQKQRILTDNNMLCLFFWNTCQTYKIRSFFSWYLSVFIWNSKRILSVGTNFCILFLVMKSTQIFVPTLYCYVSCLRLMHIFIYFSDFSKKLW